MKYKNTFKNLLNPGHTACSGCGQLIAARHVVNAAGKNTIVSNATGCLEVTTTKYPMSSWKVPWIHANFENASAVASGILAALKSQKKDKNINVIAQGGDGGTFDIGLGLISGMWERKENILYVCYDNEAYMNTGYQSSGATPHDTFTRTTWPGKYSMGNKLYKKNMVEIALAHGCNYVATATVGFIPDLIAKVKKALTIQGPKYIQILVPCIPGWGIETNMAEELGKLAVQTGLYPILEFENGKLVKKMKVPATPLKVEEYFKHQKRFKHLFKDPRGKEELVELQNIANGNIEKYGLKF